MKEWEERQKARSAKVAKEWHKQMKEQNGRFRQALTEHGISTAPVPTNEPTQSLPNTDHKAQNE